VFIHGVVPPGVTVMMLKEKIRCTKKIPGRVRIESGDPVAIATVHDVLRFQISETVSKSNLLID